MGKMSSGNLSLTSNEVSAFALSAGAIFAGAYFLSLLPRPGFKLKRTGGAAPYYDDNYDNFGFGNSLDEYSDDYDYKSRARSVDQLQSRRGHQSPYAERRHQNQQEDSLISRFVAMVTGAFHGPKFFSPLAENYKRYDDFWSRKRRRSGDAASILVDTQKQKSGGGYVGKQLDFNHPDHWMRKQNKPGYPAQFNNQGRPKWSNQWSQKDESNFKDNMYNDNMYNDDVTENIRRQKLVGQIGSQNYNNNVDGDDATNDVIDDIYSHHFGHKDY